MYLNPKHSYSQYNSPSCYITAQFVRQDKRSSIAYEDSKQMSSISQQSSEFSFSNKDREKEKDRNADGKLSIKEDLVKLEKEDLVEIVMQEIEENKILRIKVSSLQEQSKIIGSFRQETGMLDSLDETIAMSKYRQLAQYMEQYISNTNEAQKYFTGLIQELKQSNSTLKQENTELLRQIKQFKNSQPSNQKDMSRQIIKQHEETIKNLEDSVQSYIQINNENTRKYEKLKKMYELLEEQLKIVLDTQRKEKQKENQVLIEITKVNQHSAKEKAKNQANKEEYLERIKILEIQNSELKQSCFALEKTLQKKSQKIRKLLQEMEKLSEQKWQYKERYMELKSKSYINTQSTSKNSDFDSMHNDANVRNFSIDSMTYKQSMQN